MDYEFMLQRQLKNLSADLFQRHSSCMLIFEQMLKKFLAVFPTFTDHTLLHSLNVTYITNQLLKEEAKKLNADEIYIYLMAAALHDVGMGVTDKDLDKFIDKSGFREYVNEHPGISKPTIIRKFHNDFSYEIIMKYWQVLDIPNEQYAHAIGQVSRGHRKADLFNEEMYPASYDLGDGKKANIAMLAAVIRIADELDIASDRNPELLYNPDTMEDMSEKDMFEFYKHRSIHKVEYIDNVINIHASTDSNEIKEGIIEATQTIVDKLEYCIQVMRDRSDVQLCSDKIRLIINDEEISL